MKKAILYPKLLLILILSNACEDKPVRPAVKVALEMTQKDKKVVTEKLPSEPVLAQYIRIKNAMVSDDSLQTKEHLKVFPAIITAAAQGLETNTATTLVSQLKAQVADMQNSPFAMQRFQLIGLTESLLAWQQIAPAKEKIYVQYCPMYKGGNSWLSMEDKVLNPYYGSKMLRCGVIEKTLN